MARILITGATAGIGRAAAILLAHKGHTVIGAGRNAEALESLAAQSPNLHALGGPLYVFDVAHAFHAVPRRDPGTRVGGASPPGT